MARARRNHAEDSVTRNALLDAAEAILLEDGYAAVTTRRIASKTGVNSALVYYYFETMDDLFIALFRRGAERAFEHQRRALESPQPLWAFWDAMREPSNNARTTEFIAAANHRKAIRAVVASYAKKFRQMHVEVLSRALERYGLDTEEWPPASIILMLDGIARYLLLEEAFGLDIAHGETIGLIERRIAELEGERLSLDANVANVMSRGKARPPLARRGRSRG